MDRLSTGQSSTAENYPACEKHCVFMDLPDIGRVRQICAEIFLIFEQATKNTTANVTKLFVAGE